MTQHYIRITTDEAGTYSACTCQWRGTTQPVGQAEAARLESCQHLARVLRFGSVTIGGDHYLVPQS